MKHSDGAVNRALIRLNDALCQYERMTGCESVLILREQGGFEFRSQSGKPIASNDISDSQLFDMLE